MEEALQMQTHPPEMENGPACRDNETQTLHSKAQNWNWQSSKMCTKVGGGRWSVVGGRGQTMRVCACAQTNKSVDTHTEIEGKPQQLAGSRSANKYVHSKKKINCLEFA